MFGRYDVYTTTQSIYCYPDTNVLRNKLGIKDFDILKKAENEITSVRQYQMLQNPIQGHFTKNHLFRIHRFMFEQIYPFAGRIRKEQIAKGNTFFYPPNSIEKELDRVFAYIKENNRFKGFEQQDLYNGLAFTMAELNIIHPFREGNGRTIREFIRLLAADNNVVINWGKVDKELILEASISSVDDYKSLIDILKKATV